MSLIYVIKFLKWENFQNEHLSKEEITSGKKRVWKNLLTTRETQFKTTRSYIPTDIMANLNKTEKKNNYGECGEKRNLIDSWQQCKLAQPLWKTIYGILKMKKII